MDRDLGARRIPSWLADHMIEIAFAGIVVAWFGYALAITGRSYFWVDDWLLLQQGSSAGGFFEAYNNHLSVVILAIYRTSADLFGLDYTPLRGVGTLAFLAVPVALFALARRRIGAPLAGVLCVLVLWSEGMAYIPSEMNHWFALLGAVGCAAALEAGPRGDLALAAALTFSLCSASGGLAVAAACVVHTVCSQQPIRRWVVVGVPIAMWLLWWMTAERQVRRLERQLSVSDVLDITRQVVVAPFEIVGLGLAPLAVVAGIGYVAYGASLLRQGLRQAAGFLGWTTALVVFSIAVSYYWAEDTPGQFRYREVALVFAVLAVLPPRSTRAPTWSPLPTSRRRLVIGLWALALVGLTAVRWTGGHQELEDHADLHADIGDQTRPVVLALQLGDEAVSSELPLGFVWGLMTAEEARSLLDRYGYPIEATTETVDREAVRRGYTHVRRSKPPDRPCRDLTGVITVDPAGLLGVQLHGTGGDWTVEVRRFGEEWVPLTRQHAGDTIDLVLPPMASSTPWEVRADGACRYDAY